VTLPGIALAGVGIFLYRPWLLSAGLGLLILGILAAIRRFIILPDKRAELCRSYLHRNELITDDNLLFKMVMTKQVRAALVGRNKDLVKRSAKLLGSSKIDRVLSYGVIR